MAAAQGHARHPPPSKRQRFGGEIAEREGTVAVGDLVLADLPFVASRRVEPPTERGAARDSGVGPGFGGVENRVGLGVAFPAWGALEPNDVASGVEHHVDVPGWGSHTEAREVLAAALS